MAITASSSNTRGVADLEGSIMRKVMIVIGIVLLASLGATSALAGQHKRTFVAPLSGAEEVPAVDTLARGQAVFQLNKDETELSFRLIVANIENITMAHIHVAPAGANGPVVVWLYPEAPPPQLIEGQFNGILATGVITDDHLVGQLEDESLADLVELIRAGNTYVNVHTSQHMGGEVRGQIR